MSDPTALSRTIQAWAATETLRKVCKILGVDGEDMVEAVKAIKRDADAYRRQQQTRQARRTA